MGLAEQTLRFTVPKPFGDGYYGFRLYPKNQPIFYLDSLMGRYVGLILYPGGLHINSLRKSGNVLPHTTVVFTPPIENQDISRKIVVWSSY